MFSNSRKDLKALASALVDGDQEEDGEHTPPQTPNTNTSSFINNFQESGVWSSFEESQDPNGPLPPLDKSQGSHGTLTPPESCKSFLVWILLTSLSILSDTDPESQSDDYLYQDRLPIKANNKRQHSPPPQVCCLNLLTIF
jgi:hypothetical protein